MKMPCVPSSTAETEGASVNGGTYEKLRPMVLGTHVNPGEKDTDGDGPRVEQHARKKRGILVCLHHQEVSFDVTGGKKEIFAGIELEQVASR